MNNRTIRSINRRKMMNSKSNNKMNKECNYTNRKRHVSDKLKGPGRKHVKKRGSSTRNLPLLKYNRRRVVLPHSQFSRTKA